MTDVKPIKDRFAAARARLDATETAGKVERRTSIFEREKAGEQVNVKDASGIDPKSTEAFKILMDASLDPKEKIEKIAKILTFDESDPEASAKALNENRALITQMVAEFSEINEKGIQLVADNPLSELRGSMRQLMDEYHELVEGRSDLKAKLKAIDEVIKKYGGSEGLVDAMLAAQGKKAEMEALEKSMKEATATVDGLNGKLKKEEYRVESLSRSIAEDESDRLLFFKGEKKRRVRENRMAKLESETALSEYKANLAAANTDLTAKISGYEAYTGSDEWRLNEKLLEILDIGDERFIERVKELSGTTMGYIENMKLMLTSDRAQLQALLDRSTGLLHAAQNTNENVAILLEGQREAQKANGALLAKFKDEEVAETSDFEKLRHQRKIRALNMHITAIDTTIDPTSAVSAELGKTETSVTTFRDQMQEGLAGATKLQLQSSGASAFTGNAMLMRIEGLATFVRQIMSEGHLNREGREALGDIYQEMERAVMGRIAGNENIKEVGKILEEMTSGIDDKNDLILKISAERVALIDKLVAQTKELDRANKDALGIEGAVNEKLYGRKADGAPVAAPVGPGTGPA